MLWLLFIANISAATLTPKMRQAKIQMNELSAALGLYLVDCGEYPDSLAQLTKKSENCEHWGPAPYLRNLVPDPWGRPWLYKRIDNKDFELKTLGSDGSEGGEGEDMDFVLNSKENNVADNSPVGLFHAKAAKLRSYAAAKFTITDANVKELTTLADSTLNLAEEFKSNWDYGNAIHHAHLVLGRVSLYLGHVAEAKRHLKAAGQVKGSPQLNSFGPNMSLAKELVEKGEKAAVLDYLNGCEKFWNSEIAKKSLSLWRSDIAKGSTPKFGGNLEY